MKQNKKGHIHDLKGIARRAMFERGLLPDYSSEVIEEVKRFQEAFKHDPMASDLRSLPWVSIDNTTSLDLDQLTVAEELADGIVRIRVAIADVDELVKKDSATDEHAQHNTTSVYTPACIFSMLPERLSTDFTSLNEGKTRSAIVVEMVFDELGSIQDSSIYRANVCNQAKLDYESVGAWLEGKGPAPAQIAKNLLLQEQVHIQDRIAQSLKKRRHTHGALSLEINEAQPLFDGDTIVDIQVRQKNRAHELIEDLMITANQTTALYLESRGFPTLRRVLRSPQRWNRIVELAANVGEKLSKDPDAVSLEQFLSRRKKADPERFPDLSLAVVKLIGSGEYLLDLPGKETPGHFGLALASYTHSSAPNRRFPDLITQRLVKAALSGKVPPYRDEELAFLAKHCTVTEDAVNKVERQVLKSAAALFMQSRIGELFDAFVTGAAEKGTWVRTLDPPIEGKVVRSFQDLDVGDRVRVKLLNVNVAEGYIDFGITKRKM